MRTLTLLLLLSCLLSGSVFGQNLVQKSNVISFGKVFDDGQIAVAFEKAYQGIITKSLVNGSWILTLRGKKFSVAGGKLLPVSEMEREKSYDPFIFYSYEAGPAVFKKLTKPEVDTLTKTLEARKTKPIHRSTSFYDTLWQIDSESSAKKMTKTIKFLGFAIIAHLDIVEKLRSLELDVKVVAKSNTEVKTFIASLDNIDGYNFRNILNSSSRSNHSYGTAFDLIPKSYKKLTYYWQLLQNEGKAWWEVPIEKRMQVPQALVDLFEKHGFVWGGKWLFFDAVHFEYRPEILIANGL